MSYDYLETLWDLPERPAKDLEPLGKSALPGPRSAWEQAEADRALATGDLVAVKEFARAHGGPVAGVDPKFLDRLEKSAEHIDDADERGWLGRLFKKARTS